MFVCVAQELDFRIGSVARYLALQLHYRCSASEAEKIDVEDVKHSGMLVDEDALASCWRVLHLKAVKIGTVLPSMTAKQCLFFALIQRACRLRRAIAQYSACRFGHAAAEYQRYTTG